MKPDTAENHVHAIALLAGVSEARTVIASRYNGMSRFFLIFLRPAIFSRQHPGIDTSHA
jgi:hypothetical protein